MYQAGLDVNAKIGAGRRPELWRRQSGGRFHAIDLAVKARGQQVRLETTSINHRTSPSLETRRRLHGECSHSPFPEE